MDFFSNLNKFKDKIVFNVLTSNVEYLHKTSCRNHNSKNKNLMTKIGIQIFELKVTLNYTFMFPI